MSRLATSFVLGYHGCDKPVGKKALNGKVNLIHSDQKFDWLGPGAYFWESDPQRALEWAEWKAKRGDYKEPFVIGAVIDLGNCLDLTGRENIDLLRWAHDAFAEVRKKSGLKMPKNSDTKDNQHHDKLLRFLDCAVITYLHDILDQQPDEGYPDIGMSGGEHAWR